MSFRRRLLLFLVATLIGVQALTALFVFGFLRGNLVRQGERELAATAEVFLRQLNVVSDRVSDAVTVLSLDYALRKAVGERDTETLISVLRNHGTRVGASRMMMVGLDGTVDIDTSEHDASGMPFPFESLVDAAVVDGQGTSLAVLDNEAYWIVAVPVRAPEPIAFIIACVPVDNALLERLRGLSPTMRSLALATVDEAGAWNVLSKTADYRPPGMPQVTGAALPVDYREAANQDDGRLAMLARLPAADESAPVVAVLDYPLDEVLASFSAVFKTMTLVLAAGLLIAIAGAIMIARGMSQPLEALAAIAGRIARGDYGLVRKMQRSDELGALSAALSHMTASIADREAALKNAIAAADTARAEAVKANDAKSQFLSNMSHELRTPLNAIIGFSDMIAHQILGGQGNPRYTEYARDINKSGLHLLKQVQEMLDLSDAADGNLKIARARLGPGRVLGAAIESMKDAAEKARVKLVVLGDPKAWPSIDADAAKLQQSVANLIHNAIKFSDPGSTVTISGGVTGKTLSISVRDTGIGMDPEDIALVVRPFHRRRKAFDARHQGAGLGLPFAKTIIELHGGSIQLESVKEKGTTVTIELPLVEGEILSNAA